jgi:hypothetical protein
MGTQENVPKIWRMRKTVEFTKHFGERFLERVPKIDHESTLKRIRNIVKTNQCQIIFDCCLDHRSQAKIKVGKYTTTFRFQKDALKLFVTTIY